MKGANDESRSVAQLQIGLSYFEEESYRRARRALKRLLAMDEARGTHKSLAQTYLDRMDAAKDE